MAIKPRIHRPQPPQQRDPLLDEEGLPAIWTMGARQRAQAEQPEQVAANDRGLIMGVMQRVPKRYLIPAMLAGAIGIGAAVRSAVKEALLNVQLTHYERKVSPKEEKKQNEIAEDVKKEGERVEYDPMTNNYISGKANLENLEEWGDDDLVELPDPCGTKRKIIARRPAALAYLRANAESQATIGRCISIGSAFRTNLEQKQAKERLSALWGLIQLGAAAQPTKSLHELGLADDLGNDWWLEWPFMREQGFQCGPDNGIFSYPDLHHCNFSTRPLPSAEKREEIWKKWCAGSCPSDWKEHVWEGTVEELEAYLAAHPDVKEKWQKKDKTKAEKQAKREQEQKEREAKKAKREAQKKSHRKNR